MSLTLARSPLHWVIRIANTRPLSRMWTVKSGGDELAASQFDLLTEVAVALKLPLDLID